MTRLDLPHPAILALLATAIIQVGYLCWKVSADRRQARACGLRSLLRERLWWTGAAATMAGWVLFVAATWAGDISIVQPMMSTGDLLLVLAAVVWLRERPSLGEWCGIALVLAGAGILAREPSLAVQTIAWNMLIGILALTVMAGCAASLLRSLHRDGIAAVRVGLAFGTGALLTKALVSISWSWDAKGILLGVAILLAVIAANAVGLILLQIAFAHGRASFVVPVQLAMANLVVAAGAGVIFGESMGMMRIMAIAAVLVGTALCIGYRKRSPSDPPATA